MTKITWLAIILMAATICNAQTGVLYVDASATGNNSGTSWANAYTKLSDALNTANSNTSIDSILVAQGTYFPTGLQSGTNRDTALIIYRGGLKLLGGYPTGGGIRNTTANPTILSGDIGAAGSTADNSYHIMMIAGITTGADSIVVDGFGFTNAYANNGNIVSYNGWAVQQSQGAALAMLQVPNGQKTAIRNCNFTSNHADGTGGAFFLNRAAPQFSNCSFTQNSSGNAGGAAFIYYFSSPVINNCSFAQNTAAYGGAIGIQQSSSPAINQCSFTQNNANVGGGIYNDVSSTTTVEGSTFTSNTCTSSGGAVASSNSSSITIINSLFANNNASIDAGGVLGENNSQSYIFNCTFSKNNAVSVGGAARFYQAKGYLYNSIVWGNTQGVQSNGQLYADNTGADLILSDNIVEGGMPAGIFTYANGNANIDAFNTDPLFVNAAANDFHLTACSPAINIGYNASVPSGITADLDNNNRIFSTTVDLGAYEATVISDPATTGISATNTITTKWQSNNAATYYYTSNCNELIASVTGDASASTIAGNTTARVWIEPSQPALFVKRHYQITPANNASTATGKVTLYFTQAEFDAFNAVNVVMLPTGPSDNANKANVRIEKRPGTSSDGTGLPATYTGTPVTIAPVDADVVWNSNTSRWEISFNVTSFSGFFVKTTSMVLPLHLLNFSGIRENQSSLLQWKTAEEKSLSYFELQRSNDGQFFIDIAHIPAISGNSLHYSYEDRIAVDGNIYYRLKMADINATVTYSNVISLSNKKATAISISPNPAKTIIMLSINAALLKTEALLIDATGSTLQKISMRQLQQPVDISRLSNGIYFIRFNSGEIQKFIKE